METRHGPASSGQADADDPEKCRNLAMHRARSFLPAPLYAALLISHQPRISPGSSRITPRHHPTPPAPSSPQHGDPPAALQVGQTPYPNQQPERHGDRWACVSSLGHPVSGVVTCPQQQLRRLSAAKQRIPLFLLLPPAVGMPRVRGTGRSSARDREAFTMCDSNTPDPRFRPDRDEACAEFVSAAFLAARAEAPRRCLE